MIEWLAKVVGYFVLIRVCWAALEYGYSLWFAKGHDLIARYGKGSWALVTGSTDGIGLCFAQQIAKRGFNVIISGRDPAKVERVAKELGSEFPKIQTKGIVVDFSKSGENGFIEAVQRQVEGLDIALLVNNVATIRYEHIGELKNEDISYTIKLNCITQAIMLNYFLPYFKKRGRKAGIIDLGSMLSLRPSGHMELQAGIKAFNRALTLSAEQCGLYPDVDLLCLMPGWTKTNMLKDLKLSLINARPDEVASGALRDLGRTRESFGCKKHTLNGLVIIVIGFLLPGRWADKAIKVVTDYLRSIETTT